MTDGVAGASMALGSPQRPVTARDGGAVRQEPGFAALVDAPSEAAPSGTPVVQDAEAPLESEIVPPEEGEEAEPQDGLLAILGLFGASVPQTEVQPPPRAPARAPGAGQETGLSSAVLANVAMPAGSAPVVAPAPATVPEGGLIGEDVFDPDPQPAGAVLPVETKPGTAVGASPAGDVALRPRVPGSPDGSLGSGQPKIVHEPAPADVGPSKREATPDAARLYAAAAGQSGAEGAAAMPRMDSPPPMPEPRALATVRGGADSASPPGPAMPRADGLPSPEPRSLDTGRSKATETKRTGPAEARGNTVEAAAVSFRQLVGEARRAGAAQDGSDKAGGERGLPRADQATSRDDPALGMQTVRPTDAGEFRTSAPSDGAPTVRRIGRQIAAQPVLRSGGRAEVNLAPEELGHLRLSVETSEAGLRIVIEAARPETADLMRRHVEALRQELRQEGLGQVGVSIGGGDSATGRETSHPGRRGSEAAAGASGPVAATSVLPLSDTPAPRTRNAGGALDLRF